MGKHRVTIYELSESNSPQRWENVATVEGDEILVAAALRAFAQKLDPRNHPAAPKPPVMRSQET